VLCAKYQRLALRVMGIYSLVYTWQQAEYSEKPAILDRMPIVGTGSVVRDRPKSVSNSPYNRKKNRIYIVSVC
jgi:hypothetical protein